MWDSCHSRIDNDDNIILQIYRFLYWEETLNCFQSRDPVVLLKFGFFVFYRDHYYTSFKNVSCRQTPSFYLEPWPVWHFYLADKSFPIMSLSVERRGLSRYTKANAQQYSLLVLLYISDWACWYLFERYD